MNRRSHAPAPALPRPSPSGPAGFRLLTVAEAAAYLNVTERFIRRIISERRVPVVRLGRHVRLALSDLDGYVSANRAPAFEQPPFAADRLVVGDRR